MTTGIVTAIPLICFGAAAIRVSMVTPRAAAVPRPDPAVRARRPVLPRGHAGRPLGRLRAGLGRAGRSSPSRRSRHHRRAASCGSPSDGAPARPEAGVEIPRSDRGFRRLPGLQPPDGRERPRSAGETLQLRPSRTATRSAKASRAARTGPSGSATSRCLGLAGPGDDVGAGLVHRRVRAQQAERLGVERRRRSRSASSSSSRRASAGSVEALRHQHRQRRHALAQVGAGRLAGLARLGGDVEDVVGELEGRADDLAVRRERLLDLAAWRHRSSAP